MHKNKLALLVVCFVLFIVTVCGTQRPGLGINTGVNPHASPTSALLFQRPAKTVRVRLTHVETNADIVDWPYPDSEIIIKAGETLNKKTDDNGVVVFDAVPCGQQIVITVRGPESVDNGVFRRMLTCTRPQVDLGVIEMAFGGKYTLRQRKLTPMGYDAAKNVWRDANGRALSMRTFNRIMSKRK